VDLRTKNLPILSKQIKTNVVRENGIRVQVTWALTENNHFKWHLMKHNVLSQISHHSEAVDLFGSDDSCQGLIWPNHPSVERVLEVVVPDVVPGQPHYLTHGGSLHTDDCHQVSVGLQLSSQVLVASVASPAEPLSPDPVPSWVDSIPAFDQMITVVEPPSSSDPSSLHFVFF
jgi:hypothetical protein